MHFLIKLLTTFAVIFFGLSAFAQEHSEHADHHAHEHHDHEDHAHQAADGGPVSATSTGPALTHTDEIDSALAEGGEPIVADVLGVVCDFCALAMNKIFSKREEVAAIYVDLDTKALSLVLVPSASLSDDTIAELAVQAGYRVADIRRGDAALGSGA